MEKIIIDNVSGKVLKDSQGRILKDRPFNETPIQDGLVFWGQAAPEYLTIVDGLVSEAYDVRGNGLKMVQNTVVKRPSYNGSLKFVGKQFLTSLNNEPNTKTFFIIIKNVSSSPNSYAGIGNMNTYSGSYQRILGKLGHEWVHLLVEGNYASFYKNNAIVNRVLAVNNQKNILHSIVNVNFLNIPILLGSISDLHSFNTDFEISEWGWYNRVLLEQEIIYNINALNAKYQIF